MIGKIRMKYYGQKKSMFMYVNIQNIYSTIPGLFCHTVKDQRDFTSVFFVLQ